MAGCPDHSPHLAGCPACQRAARHYFTRRAMAISAGTWQYPRPAAEVAQHLRRCRQAPMSVGEIARACGLRDRTLHDILSGRTRTVTGPTAAAILAVHPAPAPRHGHLFAVGARRRLRALAVMGWSNRRISGELPAALCDVQRIQSGTRVAVTPDMARRIDALYQRARVAYQGPTQLTSIQRRSHRHALRHGWAGPDLWDDDTIDDPTARPAAAPAPSSTDCLPSVVDDGLAGRISHQDMTTAERVAVVSTLAARGWSDRRIGEWLSWPPSDSDGPCENGPVNRFRRYHQIPAGHRAARAAAEQGMRQITRACA